MGSALCSQASRLDGRRGRGCVEVQDVARVLALSPRYNQTLRASVQGDATSDKPTGSYVTDSRFSTRSPPSSPRCPSGSLRLRLLQKYSPDSVLSVPGG